MEKKKILLPTKRFFKAEEQDIDIRINLDETETLLREGDMNIVLDIEELFDKERNQSNNYKIHGKIKMVFRNMYSGDTSYNPLLKYLYLSGDGADGDATGFLPYNEFAFLRNDVIRESIDPSSTSGSTLTTYSPTFTLSGTEYTGHTSITPIMAPYHNWNLYLSYVYSHDTGHTMTYTLSGGTVNDFVAGDGIPFRVITGTTFNTLISPVEHGFNSGEYIVISGQTLYVTSIGNEVYNSEKYVLNVLSNDLPSGFTLNNVVFGKRCLDIKNVSGSTSQYYVHKHKILTNSNDYILDKIGFESSVWEDEKKILFENTLGENDVIVERNRMESLIYDFKEPFVLTGLTNNLGYTPTEVYVTVLLRNGNGYFNYPPKVGWKFNFHNTWIDEHFSGSTSQETAMGTGTTITSNLSGTTFISGNELTIGTSGLTGAFVEYNQQELKERIISESYHKFTSPTTIFDHGQDGNIDGFSGASVNNLSGLYYQPYHRVKLRELSPYIETSNTDDILNLPENTKYFENEGLWKWRDLYDHGFIDPDGNGTRFPFINNIHYVKKDINFYLRNEAYYNNKTDGLINFNNRLFDC
jgi:hypothetical protein